MKKDVKQGFLQIIIGQRKHITQLEAKEAYNIINLRLNMINVKDSYRNSEINTKCEFCENDDTIKHLFEFPMIQRLTQEEMKQ